jgi:glycine cleavage system protein P-like pyridoxal-binding family
MTVLTTTLEITKNNLPYSSFSTRNKSSISSDGWNDNYRNQNNGKHGIDVEDVREKALKYKDELSALMVTYPSTHGVF